MADEYYPPPPHPSLPTGAPWTEIQQLIANTYGIWQALTPGGAVPTGKTLNDLYDVLMAILAIQQNATSIQTLNVPVTTPMQQVQYTSLTIPDGFSLTVLASPNNSGNILVAPRNGNLQQNILTLKPGQFVQYKVKTSDALYIVGTVANDFVILTSEVK